MKKATGTVSRSICVSGRDYFVKASCEGQLVDNGIGPWECHGRTGVDRRMEMEVTCMEVESVELPSGIVLLGSELLDRYPNIHAIFEDAIFESWAGGQVEVDWDEDEPAVCHTHTSKYADLYDKEVSALLDKKIKEIKEIRSRNQNAGYDWKIYLGVEEDAPEYGEDEINNYQFECPACGITFEEEYDCAADEDCPNCGFRHISPKAIWDKVDECWISSGQGIWVKVIPEVKRFAIHQAASQSERIGAIESKMDALYSLYLVFIWSDVDPEIEGPFESQEARMERAKALRSEFGEENGLYKLDIRRDGVPEMIPFATGDFSNLNQ